MGMASTPPSPPPPPPHTHHQTLVEVGELVFDLVRAVDAKILETASPTDKGGSEQVRGQVRGLVDEFREQLRMERRQRMLWLTLIMGGGGYVLKSML